MKHLHSVGRMIDRVAGRPLFVGAIQDVTEAKAAEEALNRARSEEGLDPIPRCNGRHRSHWRILCPGLGIRRSRQWDRAPVRMTPVDQRLAWLHVVRALYASHPKWMPLDACIGCSR
jgi:hypothetical protein